MLFLQIVLKELLENGFLHGDQMTVNGKTMAENLTDVPRLPELGKQVILSQLLQVVITSGGVGDYGDGCSCGVGVGSDGFGVVVLWW